jgi:hypothetical protein
VIDDMVVDALLAWQLLVELPLPRRGLRSALSKDFGAVLFLLWGMMSKKEISTAKAAVRRAWPYASVVLFILFVGVLCTGPDRPSQHEPRISPNGEFKMVTELHEGTIVRMKISQTDGTPMGEIDTRASNVMKWAAGWVDDETLVIYSSDIGIYAWERAENDWQTATVTKAICEKGMKLMEDKYSRRRDHRVCEKMP